MGDFLGSPPAVKLSGGVIKISSVRAMDDSYPSWLVVSTNPSEKNMSQNGFIFPQFSG